MDPLLLFPEPAPPELAQTLDLAGWAWQPVNGLDDARSREPDDGWAGAVVVADSEPDRAFTLCRGLRRGDNPLQPLLLLISGAQLNDLELREDLFDDFCLTPFHPRELE